MCPAVSAAQASDRAVSSPPHPSLKTHVRPLDRLQIWFHSKNNSRHELRIFSLSSSLSHLVRHHCLTHINIARYPRKANRILENNPVIFAAGASEEFFEFPLFPTKDRPAPPVSVFDRFGGGGRRVLVTSPIFYKRREGHTVFWRRQIDLRRTSRQNNRRCTAGIHR